jgi:hypothetical protein
MTGVLLAVIGIVLNHSAAVARITKIDYDRENVRIRWGHDPLTTRQYEPTTDSGQHFHVDGIPPSGGIRKVTVTGCRSTFVEIDILMRLRVLRST